MKRERDKIERLLARNAAEQLAKVDWDRLTEEISTGLDLAPRTETMPSGYAPVFKIAAGLAVAAVVLVGVILGMRELLDLQAPQGNSTIVKSVDRQGAISIQIKDAGGHVLATVQDGRTDKGAAKCEVEILGRNGDAKAGSSRATWVIISAPTQAFAENGYDREEADTICLL